MQVASSVRSDRVGAGGAESAEEPSARDESVVLPLLVILVAIAVPVSLAVIAGAGGGIIAATLGIIAAAVCLTLLMRALLRLMGDEEQPVASSPQTPSDLAHSPTG